MVADILSSELKDKNRYWFLRVSGDNGMCAMISVACRIAATAVAVQYYPGQTDQLQFLTTKSALDSAGTSAALCFFPTASLSYSHSKARLCKPPRLVTCLLFF